MNNRSVGRDKETLAAEYLEKSGYRILERNFYCRVGEIDIIARDGDTYVFVEVKYRKAAGFGMPEEAVSRIKQEKIYKTAMYYIYKHHKGNDVLCRFDVIAVEGDKIRHYKNAFGGL